MNEFDRYDYAITMLFGGIATGALVWSAPLWAIALIYMTCCTILLYRHLPIPPRRKRQKATIVAGEDARAHAALR